MTIDAMIDATIDMMLFAIVAVLMIAVANITVAEHGVVTVINTVPTVIRTWGFIAAPAPAMASTPLL